MSIDQMGKRGASPVIGNILMVAVVVILAVVVTIVAFGLVDGFGTPTGDAQFQFKDSPAGVTMVPTALGTDVTVELNGKPIAEINSDDAGREVLIPTAPGDRITVVSQDEDNAILLSRQIENRNRIGDFIAHYTFESTSGDTLRDNSGNRNAATLYGNTDNWIDGGYEFTGSDYFEVSNLNTPVDEVSEFTIAVAYKTDTGSAKQELVEHKSGSDNWGLEIKECGPNWPSCDQTSNGTYNPNFFADESGGYQNGEIFGGTQQTGKRQVIVGTYDGSETEIYVDGESKGTEPFSSEINMGDFYIGTDAEGPGASDNLDGRIYEVRLYYRAFTDEQIKGVTKAMSP